MINVPFAKHFSLLDETIPPLLPHTVLWVPPNPPEPISEGVKMHRRIGEESLIALVEAVR